MIRHVEGDMFASGASAIVVPVNCVGAMGAGVARRASRMYPRASKIYRRVCKADTVRPGAVICVFGPPLDVFFVATKDHWRDPSRIEWVDLGLRTLARDLTDLGANVRKVAVPALGCGYGGLAWADVLPLMEQHLGPLETECLIYAPHKGAA